MIAKIRDLAHRGMEQFERLFPPGLGRIDYLVVSLFITFVLFFVMLTLDKDGAARTIVGVIFIVLLTGLSQARLRDIRDGTRVFTVVFMICGLCMIVSGQSVLQGTLFLGILAVCAYLVMRKGRYAAGNIVTQIWRNGSVHRSQVKTD